MQLLGDVGHVEPQFDPFRDSVSFSSGSMHSLRQTYYRLRNHYGQNGWKSQVTRLKWKLISVRLEIMLILIQDRCTVCAKRTVASETVFDAPNGTPR
jgi:hypothetical protein